MLKFKVVEDINITGTSFLTELNCTDAQIKEFFGSLPNGHGEKYSDSIKLTIEGEKAVEQRGWEGKRGKGIYTVYSSYGVWRIGGFSSNKHTQELKQQIESM